MKKTPYATVYLNRRTCALITNALEHWAETLGQYRDGKEARAVAAILRTAQFGGNAEIDATGTGKVLE